MWSINRILAVVIKELKQLSRDKMTFGMVVMIPLVQLTLFGYAINTDVRHIPVGYVNESASSYAPAMMKMIEATQVVDFTQRFTTVQEAEKAITRGELRAILYIPKDFTSRLMLQRPFSEQIEDTSNVTPYRPVAQWMVDGSDTVIASTLRALRSMPLTELKGLSYRIPVPTFEVVQYFNPEQRTAVNIVPGLLAIILTMTMTMFTSAAIVREREHGNMEFLITTPIKPLELMIGKVTPFIMVGLIQATIILTLGHLVFSVPIVGNFLSLFAVTILFILASLVLGLVISSIFQTQLQAMQGTVFILLPSVLLSDFMFPFQAMPKVIQHIAEVLPATHFMRLIRGVVLRGAEPIDLLPDVIWLGVFAAVGLVIAALRFKKRLD